jgi:hypothetical protein
LPTSPTPPTGFQLADAASAIYLASLAEFDLTNLDPYPWQMVKTFQSTSFAGGAQGFIAQGALASAPPNSLPAAMLVIGFAWPEFIELYQSSLHSLQLPPPGLVKDSNARSDLGYSNFYASLRDPLWQAVQFAKTTVPGFATQMPLIVVAHGPAAPLAQLAALDLVPGHAYGTQKSPATSLSSYVFSCAPFGNAAFASFYAAAVPQGFVVNLQTSGGVTVDSFPTEPNASEGYALAGKFYSPSARVPPVACPWFERDAANYVNAFAANTSLLKDSASLGQESRIPRRRAFAAGVLAAKEQLLPARVLAAPAAAYNPVLAYTLSLLTAVAYQRFEHPDLPSTIPAPFSLVTDIVAGNTVWGSLFVSPDKTVVTFRGGVSWEESVELWGTNSLTTPSWLTSTGKTLRPLTDLYEELRADLRTKLVAAGRGSSPLYFAGHDVGGSLASLALLDLTLNAQPGAGVLSGVYSFGTPPTGNMAFQQTFQNQVGGMSFQVVRPLDVIPQLVFGTALSAVTVGQQVTLNGGDNDPANGATYHPLRVYSNLLNPTAGVAADLVRTSLSSIAAAHYQSALEEHSIDEDQIRKCVIDSADFGGRLVFSPQQGTSVIDPVIVRQAGLGASQLAAKEVIVRPGHRLDIENAGSGELRLVAESLTLSPGATMNVRADAQIHIGRLNAPPALAGAAFTCPPSIVVQGADGIPGIPGAHGAMGPSGGSGQAGGWGSNGGMGGPGGRGQNASEAKFSLGDVSGTVRILVSGGAGGNGGAGGSGGMGGNGFPLPGSTAAGGRGGNGGQGGAGGAAGNGTNITVTYVNIAPGSQFVIQTPRAEGGSGGLSGTPGSGGHGAPNGSPGVAGAEGAPGAGGVAGTVTLIQVKA